MNLRIFARPAWATAFVFATASAFVAGPASAAAIHGALFTTDASANVNVNQYPTKADVYLSGGPGPSAPCTAAGMDDGVYVYQITNPSGTVVLSMDDITHREFTVSGGVIVSAVDHPTVGSLCGGVGVQVAPFLDTPNNGGVYKAWVTRKTDYAANGNTFAPGSTKTDNFHVKEPAIVPETADIVVYKFYDANANGAWDSDEVPLFNWAMNVQNADASVNTTQLTESPDGLTTFAGLDPAGNPFQVTEGNPGGTWHQSASIVDGVSTATPTNPVTGLNLVAGETTEVIFGNYCTCRSGGKTKTWWASSSGQTKINDGGTMNPEFNMLNAAYLRTAGGGNFALDTIHVAQATNFITLQNWLLNVTTTNMAYALSVQLAVMKLNIDAGYVNGKNFYVPFGGTIAQLVTDANAALQADGNTPLGDPNRALQEELKNDLEQLNYNANIVQYHACKYSFIY